MFFFFKQKTAYEIQYGLVGSEMCIRDRYTRAAGNTLTNDNDLSHYTSVHFRWIIEEDEKKDCLLYTSDAADDLLCVDLGGRRIIKKKNTKNNINTYVKNYR